MVFEKIREIIAEQTGKDVDEITLETNVKEDLDADSLDLFQIINDIEDEFDVSVEDPESIVTVQDAVDFVENHKKYRKVGEKMDGQINFADKKVYNIHQNRWHGTCYI